MSTTTTGSGFIVSPWRNKALKSYSARMSVDDDRALYDDRVANVLKAQGFSAPERPRSIYKVEKLYQALDKFGPANSPRTLESDWLKRGFDFAYACFSKGIGMDFLHPLPLESATVKLITRNPSGSAGLTSFGKKKRDVMEEALEKSKLVLTRQRVPEPCIAFKRTQFNEKTRLVWGFPYSMTIIEGLVAQPLNERFKQGMTPMAFAMPTGVLGSRLRIASYNRKWAYSLDMSSFDATISAKLIRMAFSIIKTWFDLDEVVLDGWTVRDIFDRVEFYFIHTPIVMPDSQVYRGKAHGVPSGSYFTSIVDSIVNCIICGAISSKFHLGICKRFTFVLGDDMLFWSDKKVSLDRIANFTNKQFGVSLHGSEKSALFSAGQVIHFLGRDWHNGVPDLPVQDILQRMIYPESYRHYSRDPKVAEREVKLLLLSYAAVYRQGWLIVQRCLGDWEGFRLSAEAIECEVYDQTTLEDILRESADHLSGYLRFKRKYYSTFEGGGITTTGIQFWL